MRGKSNEDREREPYRWCVYCDADCEMPEPEHGDYCPSVTGLWPVREQDLGPVCVHCEKRSLGMQCMDCGVPLLVGDMYVLRDTDTGEILTRPHVGEVVCLGCGANTDARAA